MRVLVDTNVLVRAAHGGGPNQALAVAALERLRDERHELRIVPHILCTTKLKNRAMLRRFIAPLIRPSGTFSPREYAEGEGTRPWHLDAAQTLACAQQVPSPPRTRGGEGGRRPDEGDDGNQSISAFSCDRAQRDRSTSTGRWHGLTHLLTFNAEHFRRFTSVELLEPETIAKQLS
jgi:hypothetical protein